MWTEYISATLQVDVKWSHLDISRLSYEYCALLLTQN